ncbi:hypothetical protein HNQ60_003496 [Povalibacter uvarum]|uniref:Lipoprotein n=1 Tax=Povalibacter uvarum TaxID=732238 RepID=A0A841HQK8_9GAMM|nr:hypothetical protein [Povalibacter uvarum]MBB6094609.1 hypothetical protein [Povalibacter uvarum]
MNSLQRIGSIAICLGVLVGCGSGSSEPEDRPEPPPVEDTVFGDTVSTMDKARGVQDTVDTHKQDLDRQMDANEGRSQE